MDCPKLIDAGSPVSLNPRPIAAENPSHSNGPFYHEISILDKAMKQHFLDTTRYGRRLAIQSFSTSTGGELAESGTSDGEQVTITSFSAGRDVKSRVILSLSDDTAFDLDLRKAALERGQIIIRVASVDAALRMIHSNCCGVVLLDLDVAERIGWETEDCLLQEPNCPPVILMSGQTERFELRMAMQAGAIADKSTGAEKLLRLVNETLGTSHSAQVERNATQRVILRWLGASSWSVSRKAAHRYWGIND